MSQNVGYDLRYLANAMTALDRCFDDAQKIRALSYIWKIPVLWEFVGLGTEEILLIVVVSFAGIYFRPHSPVRLYRILPNSSI
ncbi:MAG: hypothetical protein DLM72_04835 [Candidatus Nitrosopolaris wilkensis]|nr:MAG: hypothetical protein DLM72_04835 [Candidatus Nitrosopolaris wilkensis]